MRDIKQLHPDLQAAITRFVTAAKAKGYIISIGECLRTAAEQDALYAKGRTVAGSVVTNARGNAYESQHQWGVAFDIYRNDGKGAFNDTGNWFHNVAQIAKQCGLAWGGDWASIKDRPHYYLSKFSPDGTTMWLKRTYGMPDKFFKTWKGVHNMVTSDTTCDVQIKRGAYYTAKFSGADNITVTAGTGGVVTVVPIAKGADKLAAIVAFGKAGDATGIYTQVPGEAPKHQFNVKVV